MLTRNAGQELGPHGIRIVNVGPGAVATPINTSTMPTPPRCALAPTPGEFSEGGHDYRRVIPDALRTVFSLTGTPQQMARVQQALRSRELGWETERRWDATESLPATEQSQARAAGQHGFRVGRPSGR